MKLSDFPTMFHKFSCHSADDAWRSIAQEFRSPDVKWNSVNGRGGDTKEILHATISIADPRQRWTQIRPKAMNPAFAIAEVIWMVSGREDSAFLKAFFPRITEYCGDTQTFYGAYGKRLRSHFKIGDQLKIAYEALKANPESRQIVLNIWDPDSDLPTSNGTPQSSDIPCNISSILKVRNGKLEWLQIMRSNDIFRGFPNNLVQFTSLQEIMAGWLDLELGSYNHISDSLHIYKDCYDELSTIEDALILQNTDSLALPYNESRSIFHDLSSVVDDMISTESTETLQKHSIHRDFPQPYANLLHILCAELLRRRNAINEAQARADLCKNPLLLKLWNRWMFREHTSVDTRSAEKHPQNSH